MNRNERKVFSLEYFILILLENVRNSRRSCVEYFHVVSSILDKVFTQKFSEKLNCKIIYKFIH